MPSSCHYFILEETKARAGIRDQAACDPSLCRGFWLSPAPPLDSLLLSPPPVKSSAPLASLWALRKEQDKAVEEKHQAEVTSSASPSWSPALDIGESHGALGLVLQLIQIGFDMRQIQRDPGPGARDRLGQQVPEGAVAFGVQRWDLVPSLGDFTPTCHLCPKSLALNKNSPPK